MANSRAHNEAEQAILAAATKLFISKGFTGVSMQAIAEEAHINKAMLHYYYRNKQTLFDCVYSNTVQTFFRPVLATLQTTSPLPQRLHAFISGYIDMLLANPHIPLFMMHELSANKPLVLKTFQHIAKPHLTKLFLELHSQFDVRNTTTPLEHMVTNFLSLLIFPFIARDIISLLFDMSPEQYHDFIEQRKTYLYQLVCQQFNLQPLDSQ